MSSTLGSVTVSAALITEGGTVTVSGGTTVALNQSVTTGGGSVTVTAATGITSNATGAITTSGASGDTGTAGGEVLVRNTGAGAINLAGAIAANGGNSTGAGNVGGAGGVVTAIAGAGAAAAAGGVVQLSATNGITQTGAIVGGKLKVVATGGSVTLNNPGNDVSTLAIDATTAGAQIEYTDATALTIGTVEQAGTGAAQIAQKVGVSSTGAGTDLGVIATTQDLTVAGAIGLNAGGAFLRSSAGAALVQAAITTAGGAIEVRAPAGAITVTGALTSGAGAVTIESGGAVNLQAAITTTGGAVSIEGTTITSNAAGTITTTGGAGAAGGEVTLRATGGAVGAAGSIVATGGVGAVGGNDGGVVTVLAPAGQITVASISAGPAGVVQLSGTAAIGQTAGIGAGNLKVITTGGAVTLNNPANDVTTLAADLTGASSLLYIDANALTIGTVAQAGTGVAQLGAKSGAVTAGNGQTISVTATTQNLTVAQVITTLAGDVTLTVAGGALVIQAAISTSGGKATLTAATGITSTGAGSITTAGVNGSPGTAGGEVILLTSGVGAISLQGPITASGGSGLAFGQPGGNAGTVSILATDGALTLGDVTSLGGASGGGPGAAGLAGTIQLFGRGITQQDGTRLRAGGLKLLTLGGAAVVLTNAQNDVDLIAGSLGGGVAFSFADTNSVTVGVVADAGTDDASLGAQTGITQNGAAQAISIVATTNLTIAEAIGTSGGALTLTATAGTLAINANLRTDGGKVTATAATAITSALTTEIRTTGVAGAPGTAGGEVLLHATGGPITLQGAITASGGDGNEANAAGGAGGVVTLLAGVGALMVGNITTRGGTPGAGGDAGNDGIVQLSATTTIGQQATTSIQAWHLKILGTGGAVTLTNVANDVDVLAARLTNASSLTYTDATGVIVGRVDAAGTGAANIALVDGVSLGAAQPLVVKTINGTLNVLKPVEVAGAGTILLHAEGAGTNILLDATVKSGTGNITLRASGFVIQSAQDLASTEGQVIVDSQGQLAPGIEVLFTGQDTWTGQGPSSVTGGQMEGMDAQGNPIAAAITAILIDPINPSIVYISAANGGIWRTFDINRTIQVEPYDRFKGAAPIVTSAFPFSASLIGADGTIAAGAPNVGVTAGGGTNVRSVGDLGSIRFTATANGSQFDGLSVSYVDTVVAGAESADYDAAAKRITVNIQTNVTTARQVIDAINKRLGVVVIPAFPFSASLVGANGAVAAGGPHTGVTGGGAADSRSSGDLGSIRFTATQNGTQFNGLSIVYVNSVVAGNEVADYDPAVNRITVSIQTTVTTANQVIAAINKRLGPAAQSAPALPFTAALTDANGATAVNAGTPVVGVTVVGDAATRAAATFGNIRFTARDFGAEFNGLQVVYVGNLAVGGAVTAQYDAATKRLVFYIPAGGSTAQAIVDALAAAGALTGGGAYRYKIVFEDAAGTRSNASDPIVVPALAAADRLITLSNLPVGPDGTVKRVIYRTTAGGTLFKLAGSVPDNAPGRLFTDRVADNALGDEREIDVPFPLWQSLTDTMPSLSVTVLAFDPNDPTYHTIYAGTGNTSSGNEAGRQIGVLRTTNGGDTWEILDDQIGGLKITDVIPVRANAFTAFLIGAGTGTIATTRLASVLGGGADGVRATARFSPLTNANDLVFTADAEGAASNGITIVFDTTLAVAGTETSNYDEPTRTLTVRIKPGVGGSTPGQIIAAIPLDVPFSITIAANPDTGYFEPGYVAARTAGGRAAVAATATITPTAGDGNDLRFVAREGGLAGNGITIVLEDSLAAGATAAYDAFAKRLTIKIKAGPGGTTPEQIIAAVAAEIIRNPRTPVQALLAGNAAVGHFTAATRVTGGGADARAARVVFDPGVANTAIRFEAVRGGVEFNGKQIRFVDDGTAGQETASYDSANNRFDVHIRSGVTTAQQVANALARVLLVATVESVGETASLTRPVGLFRSLDGGQTFELVSSNFTAGNQLRGGGITDLIEVPAPVAGNDDRVILLAGVVSNDAAERGIWRSEDRGRAWTRIDVGTQPFTAAIVVLSNGGAVNAAVTSGGSSVAPAKASTGVLGSIRFTATANDAAFDGLRVKYVVGVTAGNERFSFTPRVGVTPAMLTIVVEDGKTTPRQVVQAVTNLRPFTASLVGADGAVAAGAPTPNVTAGGDDGAPAAGDIGVLVHLVATRNGSTYNGLTVQYIPGAAAVGSETATYDAETNTLTVKVTAGSQASHVVAAINAIVANPYTLRLVGDDPVVAGPNINVTTGGGPGLSTGVLGEIRFTATQAGTLFDGLSVNFVNTVTLGNERASYVAPVAGVSAAVLTIAIETNLSTASRIVDAINTFRPFNAELVGADVLIAAGPATPANVTSEGAPGAKATGVLGSVRFTAARNGAAFNGLIVEYHDNVNITGGNETASYNAQTNKITVEVKNGTTTAAGVVNAVNAILGSGYSAALVVRAPGDTVVTAGGERGTPFSATFGVIRFTATRNGSDLDNFSVEYVAGVTAGNERSAYDPTTNRLTVAIADGATTATQVIAALNNQRPFTASADGVDGRGDGQLQPGHQRADHRDRDRRDEGEPGHRRRQQDAGPALHGRAGRQRRRQQQRHGRRRRRQLGRDARGRSLHRHRRRRGLRRPHRDVRGGRHRGQRAADLHPARARHQRRGARHRRRARRDDPGPDHDGPHQPAALHGVGQRRHRRRDHRRAAGDGSHAGRRHGTVRGGPRRRPLHRGARRCAVRQPEGRLHRRRHPGARGGELRPGDQHADREGRARRLERRPGHRGRQRDAGAGLHRGGRGLDRAGVGGRGRGDGGQARRGRAGRRIPRRHQVHGRPRRRGAERPACALREHRHGRRRARELRRHHPRADDRGGGRQDDASPGRRRAHEPGGVHGRRRRRRRRRQRRLGERHHEGRRPRRGRGR